MLVDVDEKFHVLLQVTSTNNMATEADFMQIVGGDKLGLPPTLKIQPVDHTSKPQTYYPDLRSARATLWEREPAENPGEVERLHGIHEHLGREETAIKRSWEITGIRE